MSNDVTSAPDIRTGFSPEVVSLRAKKFARDYALIASLGIIWGMAFVAIKAVEPVLTPVNITLLRWLLASAALLVLAPFLGKPSTKFEKADLPRFLLVSFANVVVYHLTLNFSEQSISAGLAVLLVKLGPIFILILSRLFLGERAGRRIAFTMLLAVSGAAILSFGSGFNSGRDVLPGMLEAAGTAFFYSVFGVFSKPLVHKYGARPLAIWTGLAGTAMLLPLLSRSFFSQAVSMGITGWGMMLYLSLLSTVAGYMLFYTLVSKNTVTGLSIQLYITPVVGVAAGALLLGEPVTAYTIVGGAAMLSAVALATAEKGKGNVQAGASVFSRES